MAERMLEQARERVRAGRVEDGVRLLRIVANRARDGGDPHQHARCLEELGHALVTARQLEEGLVAFTAMVDAAKQVECTRGEGGLDTTVEEDARGNMAFVYRALGMAAEEGAAKASYYELASAWHTRRIACATRRRIAQVTHARPVRGAKTRRGTNGTVVRQFYPGGGAGGTLENAGFWILEESGIDMFLSHGDVYRLWASSGKKRMQALLRRSALVQYVRAKFLVEQAILLAHERNESGERLATMAMTRSRIRGRIMAVENHFGKDGDPLPERLAAVGEGENGMSHRLARCGSIFTHGELTPNARSQMRRFGSFSMDPLSTPRGDGDDDDAARDDPQSPAAPPNPQSPAASVRHRRGSCVLVAPTKQRRRSSVMLEPGGAPRPRSTHKRSGSVLGGASMSRRGSNSNAALAVEEDAAEINTTAATPQALFLGGLASPSSMQMQHVESVVIPQGNRQSFAAPLDMSTLDTRAPQPTEYSPEVSEFIALFMRGAHVVPTPEADDRDEVLQAPALLGFEQMAPRTPDRASDKSPAASRPRTADRSPTPRGGSPFLGTGSPPLSPAGMVSPRGGRVPRRRGVLNAAAAGGVAVVVAVQTLRVAAWMKRMLRSIRGGRRMWIGRPLMTLRHAPDRAGAIAEAAVAQAVSLLYQIHLPEVANADGLSIAIENSVRWPKEDMSDASSVSYLTQMHSVAGTRPNSASSTRRPPTRPSSAAPTRPSSAASTRKPVGGHPMRPTSASSARQGMQRPPSAASTRPSRPASGGSSRTWHTNNTALSFNTGLKLWQGIPEVQPVRVAENAAAAVPKLSVSYFDVAVASTPLHGVAPAMLAFAAATFCPVRRELTLRLPSPLELTVQQPLSCPPPAVDDVLGTDEGAAGYVQDTVYLPDVASLDDIIVDVDHCRAKVYAFTRSYPPSVVLRYSDRGEAVDPHAVHGAYNAEAGTLTLVAKRLPASDPAWCHLTPATRSVAAPLDGTSKPLDTAPRYYFHNGWEEELEPAVAADDRKAAAPAVVGIADPLGLPFTTPRMVIYSALGRKAAHAGIAAALCGIAEAWHDRASAAARAAGIEASAPALTAGAAAVLAVASRRLLLAADVHVPAAVAAAAALTAATAAEVRHAQARLAAASAGYFDRRRLHLVRHFDALAEAPPSFPSVPCLAAVSGARPTLFSAAGSLRRVARGCGARAALARTRGAVAAAGPVAVAATVAVLHAGFGRVRAGEARICGAAAGFRARAELNAWRWMRHEAGVDAAVAAAGVVLCATKQAGRVIRALDVLEKVLRGYAARAQLGAEKVEADLLYFIRAEAGYQARAILESDRRMWALTKLPLGDDVERAAQGALMTRLTEETKKAEAEVSQARHRVGSDVLDRLGDSAPVVSPLQEMEEEHQEWLGVQQELALPFLQGIGRGYVARRELVTAHHRRAGNGVVAVAASVAMLAHLARWCAGVFRVQRIGRAMLSKPPLLVLLGRARAKQIRVAKYQRCLAEQAEAMGSRTAIKTLPSPRKTALVRRTDPRRTDAEARAAAVTIQRYWRGSKARGGLRVDWEEVHAASAADPALGAARLMACAGVRTGKKLRLIQAFARAKVSAMSTKQRRDGLRDAYVEAKERRRQHREAQRNAKQIFAAAVKACLSVQRVGAQVAAVRRAELAAYRASFRACRREEIEEARAERLLAERLNAGAVAIQKMERGRQARHAADILLGREPKIVKYRKARIALSAAQAIQKWLRLMKQRRANRERDIANRAEIAARRRQRFAKVKLLQAVGRGGRGRRAARQVAYERVCRVITGLQAAGRALPVREALVTTEEYAVRRAAVDTIQRCGRSWKERLVFTQQYNRAHRAARTIQGIVRCGDAKFKAGTRRRIRALREPGMLRLALYTDAPKQKLLPMLNEKEVVQLVEDEEFERPYIAHEPFIIFDEIMLPNFIDERNLIMWFRDTYDSYVKEEAAAWNKLRAAFTVGAVVVDEALNRDTVASAEHTFFDNIALYGVQQESATAADRIVLAEQDGIARIAAAHREGAVAIFLAEEAVCRAEVTDAYADAFAVLFSRTVVAANASEAKEKHAHRLLKDKMLVQREETLGRAALQRDAAAPVAQFAATAVELAIQAAADRAVRAFLDDDEPNARHGVLTMERSARAILRQTFSQTSERPFRDTMARYTTWEASRRDRLGAAEAEAFDAISKLEAEHRSTTVAVRTEARIGMLLNRQKVVYLRLCRAESLARDQIFGVFDHFVSITNRTTFLKESLQETEAVSRAEVVIEERMVRMGIDREAAAQDTRSRGGQAFFIAQGRLMHVIHNTRRDAEGEERHRRADLREAFVAGAAKIRAEAEELRQIFYKRSVKGIVEQEAPYREYFEKLERTHRRRAVWTFEEMLRVAVERDEAHWVGALEDAHDIMRTCIRRDQARQDVRRLDEEQRDAMETAETSARKRVIMDEFIDRVAAIREVEALDGGSRPQSKMSASRPNSPGQDTLPPSSQSVQYGWGEKLHAILTQNLAAAQELGMGDDGDGWDCDETSGSLFDVDPFDDGYELTPRGTPVADPLDLTPPPLHRLEYSKDAAKFRTSVYFIEQTSRRRIARWETGRFRDLMAKWGALQPELSTLALKHRLNPDAAARKDSAASSASLRSLTADLAAVESSEMGLDAVFKNATMRLYKADVCVELRVKERFAREAIEREEAVRYEGLGLPGKLDVDCCYLKPKHVAEHEAELRRRMEAYALDTAYLWINAYFQEATAYRFRDAREGEEGGRRGLLLQERDALQQLLTTFKAGWGVIRSWETSRVFLEGEEARQRQALAFEEDAKVATLQEVLGRLRACYRAALRTQRRAAVKKELQEAGLVPDDAAGKPTPHEESMTPPPNANLKRFSLGNLGAALDTPRDDHAPYVDKHPKLAPAIERHFGSSVMTYPPFCQAHRRPESLVPGGLLAPLPPHASDTARKQSSAARSGRSQQQRPSATSPHPSDVSDAASGGGGGTPTGPPPGVPALAFASPEPRGAPAVLAPQALVGSQVGSVARWWAATVLDGLAHPSQEGLSLSVKYDRRHFRLQLLLKHVLLPYVAPQPPAPPEANHVDVAQLLCLHWESCKAIGDDDGLTPYDVAGTKDRHKRILTQAEAAAIMTDRAEALTTRRFLVYVARLRLVAAAFQQLTGGASAALRAVWNFMSALQSGRGYLPLHTLLRTAHKFSTFPNRVPTFSSAQSWGPNVQYGEDLVDRLDGLRRYPWTPLGPLASDDNAIPPGSSDSARSSRSGSDASEGGGRPRTPGPSPVHDAELTLVGVADFVTALFLPLIHETYTRHVVEAQPTPASPAPSLLFGVSHAALPEPFFAALSGFIRAYELVADTEYAKQLRSITGGAVVTTESKKLQAAAHEGRHALDGVAAADVEHAQALLAAYGETLVARGYPPQPAKHGGAPEEGDGDDGLREFPVLFDGVARAVCALAGITRAPGGPPYCTLLADALSESFVLELRRTSPWSVTYGQAVSAMGLLRELPSPYRVFARSKFMASLHTWALCVVKAADFQHRWEWPSVFTDDALAATMH